MNQVFAQVAGIAWKLSVPPPDASPSTSRGAVATMLLHSVAHHATGLSQYLTSVENSEPATVAVLARVLWEACDEFHYGYLDRIPEAEHELRWAVRCIHHEAEHRVVGAALGVGSVGKETFDAQWLYGALGRTVAQQNSLFAGLTDAERGSILEGRRARSRALPARSKPFGVDAAVGRAIYKLLSNCVHSTGLGTFIARTPGSPALSGTAVVRLSVEASCHCLSWTLTELLKRRRGLRRTLSEDELTLLKLNVKPEFWRGIAGRGSSGSNRRLQPTAPGEIMRRRG